MMHIGRNRMTCIRLHHMIFGYEYEFRVRVRYFRTEIEFQTFSPRRESMAVPTGEIAKGDSRSKLSDQALRFLIAGSTAYRHHRLTANVSELKIGRLMPIQVYRVGHSVL